MLTFFFFSITLFYSLQTTGQSGLERINERKTNWLIRKVRKLIKADDILEEQLVNVNKAMVADMADMADLAVNISSNSADLKSNNLHILDIQATVENNNAAIVNVLSNIEALNVSLFWFLIKKQL